MTRFSPIFLIIGVLLVILSGFMLLPAAVDFFTEDTTWQSFLISAFLTAFVGGILIFANQGDISHFTLKQTFILTVVSWVILVIFAALPLRLAHLDMDYTDAFFESMSGLTTTGATVIVGLDSTSKGVLFWRAILQWLGGIGIIVLAMAILPILKIGGMQLFRTESSDKSEKVLPRAKQLSSAIGSIYLFFTVICMICLWTAGMDWFDAMCHAMTTLATAGFSTHDASIGHFDNYAIESIITLFMIVSGIPFVLYIQFLRGRSLVIWRDAQVRWFISMVVFAVICTTLWLYHDQYMTLEEAFRKATFNVVSVVTTTGFSTSDYYTWGSFAVIFLFLLSVVGGCTGSTTGGIKIFRYQVLFETAKVQVSRLVQPHGVFRPLFNNKPLDETAISSVLSFFILFAFFFTILAGLLSLTGLDYITSMSAAASAMANLGPGLGEMIGPSGNYSEFSDVAKWIMSIGMLIGRLEIFTFLVLFSPYFWKN